MPLWAAARQPEKRHRRVSLWVIRTRGTGGSRSPYPVLVVKSTFLVSGMKQKIFMPESDASNFLKRRGKRSPKSQDEVSGKDAGWSPSRNGIPKLLDVRLTRALNDQQCHIWGQ